VTFLEVRSFDLARVNISVDASGMGAVAWLFDDVMDVCNSGKGGDLAQQSYDSDSDVGNMYIEEECEMEEEECEMGEEGGGSANRRQGVDIIYIILWCCFHSRAGRRRLI